MGAGSSVGTFVDGVGTNAGFEKPWGIAINPTTGVVFVADAYVRRPVRITMASCPCGTLIACVVKLLWSDRIIVSELLALLAS